MTGQKSAPWPKMPSTPSTTPKKRAPRAIAGHEEAIRAITTDVMDRLDGRDTCDLVTEVAQPVVARVIGSFMGLDPADDELRTRLADGNRRYEERFGRIYLVRAAGRSGAELLDLLEQRLTNDPDTELGVTRGQLAEIALLRLEGQVTA